VAGFLLAVPAGGLWVAALRAHDVVPDAVHFAPQLWALPVALGVELATSVGGAFIAAFRTSRVRPAIALTETATGRRDVHPVRTTLGLVLVAAGVVLSAVLAGAAPEQSGDAAFFVMLAECVGVGMLGPLALRAVARVLRPVARRGLARVALDDLATMTRALSGALVPLVLAAAFAAVKVATHTTAAHVTGIAAPAADRWTDYSGTAVYCTFAAVAALHCFITVLVGRRGDLAAIQLAGATRQHLVRLVVLQTMIVAATALVLAAAVAGATLVPVLHTSLGVWVPYVPPAAVAGGVVLVGAVVAAGMVVPAAVMSRRPPVEVVRIAT
jgi:putative ABC transport system permease protein